MDGETSDIWDDSISAAAPAPPFSEWRVAAVEMYIEDRHTDPGLRIADAAKHFGVSERTIRRDLWREGKGDKWENMVRQLRIATAKKLLIDSRQPIRWIARRSGYDSATSFTAAFKRETDLTPLQWRLAHGGPRRGGGATGAARRAAQRAQALEQGAPVPSMQRPLEAEYQAWLDAEMRDAATRLRLENGRGSSIEELAAEVNGPRGFGRIERNRKKRKARSRRA